MFDRESLTASMLQISSLKECYVVVLKKDSMKDTFSTRRTVLNFWTVKNFINVTDVANINDVELNRGIKYLYRFAQ